MKVSNAIKKLEKAGFAVSKTDHCFLATKQGRLHRIEFSRNGRSEDVVCIRVIRTNDFDDPISDYFAGFFCDSVTQAIRHVG